MYCPKAGYLEKIKAITSRLLGSRRERKSGVVRKRRMEQKSKNGVSIIGGADGPTSIFIAGPSEKQPLKVRIKNSIYRYKRKK